MDRQTGEPHTVHMYGSWLAKGMKIYLGQQNHGGRLLAYADRRSTWGDIFHMKQTYELTIMPGVDSALCVLLCMAFDGFLQQST